MGSYAKGIILIIILLFFITFGVKNSQPVRLNYYLDILTGELPLYGLEYISMLIGIFIGILIGVRNRFQMRKMVKNLNNEIRELREKGPVEKADDVQSPEL